MNWNPFFTFGNLIVEHECPKLGDRIVRLSARRLAQSFSKEERIFLAIQDLTKERQSNDEIINAKKIAESANQTKSAFLANMSHEIRTPLGAILGYTEVLAHPDQPNQQRQYAIARIRKNVDHLMELVDEILDISKIEAGKLEVEQITFDLLPELAETFVNLENRAKEKGLDFAIDFSSDIPESIVGCPKRLRQIIINIVGNALKFTEHGGVKIEIKYEGKTSNANNEKLSFIVTDTGPGIAAEQQCQLFETFKQADSSITRRFGGSGLGLVLAKRFSKELGGDLSLTKSQLNLGSTFTITINPGSMEGVKMVSNLTLPALERHANQVSHWFNKNDRLSGLRILLVEDSPDIRALMKHFLQSSDASVEEAENGAAAICKIESEDNYDVILMDMQMPILGGYEATQKLREMGLEPPIIAATAHVMKGEQEKCLAAGCDAYISKPVKSFDLIDIVENIAKRKVKASKLPVITSHLSSDPLLRPLVIKFVNNNSIDRFGKMCDAAVKGQRYRV